MAVTFAYTKVPGVGYLQNLARTRGWPYVASWAHRISGILLAVYACLHVITLSSLRTPEVFEGKMAVFAAFPTFLEWFLAVPVIYHALNGGRLILYETFGNRDDRAILGWVIRLSVVYLVLLGFFMGAGNQAVSAVFFWVYMAAISGFITYLTLVKLRKSGTSFLWKLQRISGAFLFLMIPAHMLFMHLDPALGRDAQVIISRMNNGFIKVIDLLLVCSVLYHAAYGLHGISRDYLSSRKLQLGCTLCIVAMMAIFTWMGVKLTILV